MVDCPQDARYHAEGNVAIHTRMACEVLASLEQWRDLPEHERLLVFAGVLLHDVAKPDCTVDDGGRWTSRGHSARGESLARRLLWEMGASLEDREQVAGWVRHHQAPFFVIDADDAAKRVHRLSHIGRCDRLALVAEADGRGRTCLEAADQQKIVDNVAMFVELCREQSCLDQPRAFASDHSRFLYFRTDGRDSEYKAFDDTRCEVTLMSGLPGAGKDHWLAVNAPGLPVVSLEAIRAELRIAPDGTQGKVIARARELAREHLRAHRSFAWNATNLSRSVRREVVDLCAGYKARIRIIYIDVARDLLHTQNRQRPNPVPTKVIERLLSRWTVPDPTEAHQVDWHMGDQVPSGRRDG
jgi:predicted kinase